MMAKSGMFDYGTYLAVSDGVTKFQLHDGRETTAEYSGKVDAKIKIGDKVVLRLQYSSSNWSDFTIEEVYHQNSVRTGTGRIDYVNGSIGYITVDSQQQNRVFFFARNLRHPLNKPRIPLYSLLSVGDKVSFEALPNYNFTREKASYRAVRVTPDHISEKPKPIQIKHVEGQIGVIVKVAKHNNMYAWSCDLGKVFCPQSSLNSDTKWTVGNWIDFDARQQPEMEGCNWVATKSSVTQSAKNYLTFLQLKNKWADLVLTNCPGMVTNLLETKGQGVIWSWQLGKVLMTPDTVGWKKWKPKSYVLFEAQEMERMKFDDIGWKATKIWASTSSADSFNHCIAYLVDFCQKDTCAIVFNEKYGNILMTYLDYYIDVPNLEQELNKYEEFDVWFVSDLKHHSTEYRALYVRPVEKPKPVVNEKVVSESAAFLDLDDDFLEEIERELNLLPETEVTDYNCDNLNDTMEMAASSSTSPQVKLPDIYLKDPHEYLQTGAVPQIDKVRVYQDNSTQTEESKEFRFFRVIRENKPLLNVMKDKYRNLILPMTQLMSSRFKPDLSQASADTVAIDSRLKTVSTQTASTPEQSITATLIADMEIFDLMVDIDSDLLFMLA